LGCFGQIFFLFALRRKKRGKVDVVTMIVTGFSLQVTLARYGVDFVNWGRKNIVDQQYEKYDKTFAYLRVRAQARRDCALRKRRRKELPLC
jgi:hypothetical protein